MEILVFPYFSENGRILMPRAFVPVMARVPRWRWSRGSAFFLMKKEEENENRFLVKYNKGYEERE
jgi:hypothetical protein